MSECLMSECVSEFVICSVSVVVLKCPSVCQVSVVSESLSCLLSAVPECLWSRNALSV
jgi:hypothetical protein